MKDQDLLIQQIQYCHCCWWYGNASSQGICSNGIELVITEYSGFSPRRFKSFIPQVKLNLLNVYLMFFMRIYLVKIVEVVMLIWNLYRNLDSLNIFMLSRDCTMPYNYSDLFIFSSTAYSRTSGWHDAPSVPRHVSVDSERHRDIYCRHT